MLRSHAVKTGLVSVALLVAFTLLVAASGVLAVQANARVIRLTPVLSVEAIEPVVPFWRGLGWEALNPVENGGRLAFIAFAKDGREIHYQTLAQIESRYSGARDLLVGSTSMLYLTVDDLDLVVNALGSDVDVVIPRARTPWGAEEIYVREPGGHLIGFAEFGRD